MTRLQEDAEKQEENCIANRPSELHNGTMKTLLEGWSKVLMEEGTCMTSLEEAMIMAEVLLEDLKEQEDVSFLLSSTVSSSLSVSLRLRYQAILEKSLQENMGMIETKDLANDLLALNALHGHDGSDSEVFVNVCDHEDDHMSVDRGDHDDDRDDDGLALFDGECELCDRYIRLTKHHLIPKSTWPRLEVKLMHAAEAIKGGNKEKATMILGPGLVHLLTTDLQPNKQVIRSILHETCDVCRPRHSTIHRTHDNMTLALSYSTIDLLLQDKQIWNYCRWASKQRVGKYAAS